MCVCVADLKIFFKIRAWALYFVVCVFMLLFVWSIVDLKKKMSFFF